MSRPQPLRGPITDYLLDELASVLDPVLVGDAVAPKAGGWTGGNIGDGDFVPYVVLGTGTGNPLTRLDAIRDQSADDWSLGYTLTSYGGLRKQADDVADLARTAWQVISLNRSVDLGQPWGIQSRTVNAYGSVEPQYVGTTVQWWQVRDSAVLRISARKT